MRGIVTDRLLAGLTAGVAVLITLYAAGAGAGAVQVVGAWVATAVIHLCLITVARATSRAPGLSPANRRFWRSVAGAATIYLAGDLAQVVTAIRDPAAATSVTGGPFQVTALALGSAWMMLLLLTVPLGFRTRPERSRFWLDVATVMVAAAVVGWHLVVPERPGAVLDMAPPVLAGPVILLICVFVMAKLIISGTAPFTRACGMIAAGGAVLKTVADAVGRDGLTDGRAQWYLACSIAAHALLVIALRVNQKQIAGRPGMLQARRRKPYSLLPYAAIAVTYLLLVVAVLRDQSWTVGVALTGAAVSTLLVVLRQLTAFRDNARLLEELDVKVRELHESQEGLRVSLAERDALAARLHHHAFHDGLTGLPNRSLYAERVDAALAAGEPVAVMLIDLDDFKQVNDEWGHAAGDALLREIAQRLTACVRETDTVARIGGDEFAVLLGPGLDGPPTAPGTAGAPATSGAAGAPAAPGTGGTPAASGAAGAPATSGAVRSIAAPASDDRGRAARAREVAARIVATVEQPVVIPGAGPARVGASVGIAVASASTRDGDALLREADHAMYEVKRDGKGAFALAPAR